MHLTDGTYFGGRLDDDVQTYRGLVKLRDLVPGQNGDQVRVRGWTMGDFPGDGVPWTYVGIIMVRENATPEID